MGVSERVVINRFQPINKKRVVLIIVIIIISFRLTYTLDLSLPFNCDV